MFCLFLIVHTDLRDSVQTVDHSPADVAYLRLTAHTEEKRTVDKVKVPPRRILDAEFQSLFDMTKNIPPYQPPSDCKKSDSSIAIAPELVQIGCGVYATSTITSKLLSSVGQEIGYCLDQLFCTCIFNSSNGSAALREQSHSRTHNLHHFTTQRHVRFCYHKSSVCYLL